MLLYAAVLILLAWLASGRRSIDLFLFLIGGFLVALYLMDRGFLAAPEEVPAKLILLLGLLVVFGLNGASFARTKKDDPPIHVFE
ncbi:MAG TPA: hypothetical protein VN495_04365 [Candidatus Paceibacterota bacterium]|nr:hypothetical protein [Candidatus Paceibacterota bacterium]